MMKKRKILLIVLAAPATGILLLAGKTLPLQTLLTVGENI